MSARGRLEGELATWLDEHSVIPGLEQDDVEKLVEAIAAWIIHPGRSAVLAAISSNPPPQFVPAHIQTRQVMRNLINALVGHAGREPVDPYLITRLERISEQLEGDEPNTTIAPHESAVARLMADVGRLAVLVRSITPYRVREDVLEQLDEIVSRWAP